MSLFLITFRYTPFVYPSCSRLCRIPARSASFGAVAFKPRKSSKAAELPDGPARTRFAPSPTGYLHLGSLRTALFNYLLAKKTGGQFLLRIEDTDQKRIVPDAERRLFEDLRWAGLQWDEGPEVGGPCGPYKQSERTALYREHADKLLETGHAYRCFCTPKRLNDLAEQRAKLGLPTDYDRTCASIPKEEADDRAANGELSVVRLRVPDKYPAFVDLIYGTPGKGLKPAIRSASEAYEDPVLLKSDGLPTYHLANVVDDHHMKITHVIRGTEWLPSTPKHLAMYQAFGWDPPSFAHVGLLVDMNGNKLSKRNLDIDVSSYRNSGYLPEVLNNFVALLGWYHKNRSDVMSPDELIESFTMNFTKGNTVVTNEKLNFLQHQHNLRRLVPGDPLFDQTVDKLVALIQNGGHITCSEKVLNSGVKDGSLREYVANILEIDAKNFHNAPDFLSDHAYFFTDIMPTVETPAREAKLLLMQAWLHFAEPQVWDKVQLRAGILKAVDVISQEFMGQLSNPDRAEVEKAAKKYMYKHLRAALADGKPGPGVVEMMEVLGSDICLQRMERYLHREM